jgi:flagellar protein FliJ
MSREQRIQLLLQVAEERGQEASRSLAHRQQLLAEADNRLVELNRYREQYAEGGATQGASFTVGLKSYWQFLSQLNSAIADQMERLDQHRLAVEQATERWRNVRVEMKTLEKVIERIRAADERKRERQDQRILDDRSRRLPGIM